MPSQKRRKTNTLTGKTYYVNPKKLGEHTDGFKSNRPMYILRSIDEKRVLAIKSTRTPSITAKDIKKYLEYVAKDGERSWMRMDMRVGYEVFFKEDLWNDKNNLKDDIKLNENQLKILNKYYKGNIWIE